MSNVILYKASENIAKEFNNAVKKICGIFSLEIKLYNASNIQTVYRLIDSGIICRLIVIDWELSIEERNAIRQILVDSRSKKTFLALKQSEVEFFTSFYEKNRIIVLPDTLAIHTIYSLIKSVTTSKKSSLDIRVIKGILTSVIGVIEGNLGEKLTPLPVTESATLMSFSGVSGVFSFYGDGLQGAISLSTPEELMRMFVAKILGIAKEQMNEQLFAAVIYEFGNQILEAIKGSLKKYEYNLMSGFHLVAFGKNHIYRQSSLGTYYTFPFQIWGEKFELHFCYKIYNSRGNFKQERLDATHVVTDVRLMNAVKMAISDVFGEISGLEVEFKGVSFFDSGKDRVTECIQLATMHTSMGHYVLAVSVNRSLIEKLFQNLAMSSQSFECDPDSLAQMISELTNMLQEAFFEHARHYGYNFNRHLLVGCASFGQITYQIAGVAKFLQFQYSVMGQMFEIVCGIFSEEASILFDIWDCLKNKDSFARLVKP